MIWHGETARQRLEREAKGVRRYAWFPEQMSSGDWVWLEHYWTVPGFNLDPTWEIRAVNLEDCDSNRGYRND
jgi:hypothetical protein